MKKDGSGLSKTAPLLFQDAQKYIILERFFLFSVTMTLFELLLHSICIFNTF